MNSLNPIALTALVVVLSSFSNSATATPVLMGRDLDGDLSTNEAWYDTDTNLTWLDDANYAMTSGFTVDGKMTWTYANTWAANLDIDGYGGWRLAGADSSCTTTYFCVGSEMGHLFYNTLGNVHDSSVNTITGPFTNVVMGAYWSNTTFTFNPNDGYYYSMGDGHQGYIRKPWLMSAWALQTGDIGVSTGESWAPHVVPVPAAVWLFGTGLLGLVGLARRKKTLIQ